LKQRDVEKLRGPNFIKLFFVENYVSGAVFTNGPNKLAFFHDNPFQPRVKKHSSLFVSYEENEVL
jgi:hypothetical protein